MSSLNTFSLTTPQGVGGQTSVVVFWIDSRKLRTTGRSCAFAGVHASKRDKKQQNTQVLFFISVLGRGCEDE